ncbi:MAG: DinB family protein [Cyclobacteriaceae bacterium]|nr:DinB family protein [Cyclobacteriaceae bacterium]
MTSLEICLLQWNTYNRRMLKVFETISDADFTRPIVAGGNSPSWLLGHLVETDDALLELLGIGKRMFPDLATIYHHNLESNQSGHLSKIELVSRWQAILAKLDSTFSSMSEADWHARHTVVSEEDFKKEPHRNKLNVMLTRVTHKASHLGQIAMQTK